MASAISQTVFEIALPAATAEAVLEQTMADDASALLEFQYQGLWARLELEAVFAAGLMGATSRE